MQFWSANCLRLTGVCHTFSRVRDGLHRVPRGISPTPLMTKPSWIFAPPPLPHGKQASTGFFIILSNEYINSKRFPVGLLTSHQFCDPLMITLIVIDRVLVAVPNLLYNAQLNCLNIKVVPKKVKTTAHLEITIQNCFSQKFWSTSW